MNKKSVLLTGLLLLGSCSAGAVTPRAAEDASSAVEVSASPAPRAKTLTTNKAKSKVTKKVKKPKAKAAKSKH